MDGTWKRSLRRILAPWGLLLILAGATEAKVWEVTNDNDNGAVGTLRHAVAQASSGDEIRIPILGLVLESQITLDKNLTLVGTCPDGTPNLQQLREARLFEIPSGVACTLRNLTLTGGKPRGYGAHGGALRNRGTLRLEGCTVQNSSTLNYNGGGLANEGTLTLSGCTVQNNRALGSLACGGGVSNSGSLRLENRCTVQNNSPENLYGSYSSDGTNQIGSAPGRSSLALGGQASGSAPVPRSTLGEPDAAALSRDLKNPDSPVALDVRRALSDDLGGGTLGNATLYDAFAYENVPLADPSGAGELTVEFTASWPDRVRYYAAFARADGSGYELPPRGVQFEIRPGHPLLDGVTPPSFYIPGEGLMTWRHTVTDNGPLDLNPTPGVVTFRAASLRAAATSPSGSSGGGCDAGTGFAALLLLGLPLARRRSR